MPGPLGGQIFDSHCTSMTLVLYVMAVAVVNNNMPIAACMLLRCWIFLRVF